MATSAAVVGLGNIGMGYDYECVDGSRILTHAMAYHHHPEFELVGGVDTDVERRRAFERKFAAPAYSSVAALNKQGGSEVVSIAVPTELHFEVFSDALAGGARAIVVEKPMARSVGECREMISQAKSAGCVLMVNFIRRYEPGAIELRRMISGGAIGRIYKGIVWYSGGIANNGSHAIDLLIDVLGKAGNIRMLSHGQVQEECDFSTDLVIDFGGVPVYFLATGESEPALMEIELMATDGCVRYADAGEKITVRRTESDPLFPECVTLQRGGETKQTDLFRYQYHVVDAVNRRLQESPENQADGIDVLGTALVLDEISRLAEGANRE